MPTPSLKEFAEQVPVCEQTSDLAAVLEIFRSSECDAIVVVSEEQCPLGVVNLRQIMPYLLSSAALGESGLTSATKDFDKPLSQLEPPIIQPLTILPAQLNLSQFWACLNDSGDRLSRDWGRLEGQEPGRAREIPSLPHPYFAPTKLARQNSLTEHWALVGGDGKFLGLLNSWRVLKFLAPNFTANDTSANEELQLTSLKPLVQLLEQLPLPLSLQTATGQVVAQNLTWRQQVGTSPDLDWVRRSTAAMLDSPCVERHSVLMSDSTIHEHSSAVPEDAIALGREAFAERSALAQSPFALRKAAKERYEAPAQAMVQHYCAIDSPYMAATVSKRRVLLSALPVIKIPDAPASRDVSAPASETQPNSQERVFSFVKIPLSPSVFLPERDWASGALPQSSIPLPQSPIPKLWLVLAQDTTEQQQFAKELAAKNADLIHLNRLKDEFLACISHELKTPLTAVLGLSSLLKDQTLGELNERQARYARLIYQSGRQLMTVVNDILDLTRMETGQLELTLEPVQIQTVCDRAYSQAQQLHPEKEQQEEEPTPQTRFTLEIEPGLEMIVADELRLRQMLMHLLSNALKFTDAGGEIGLTVNRWDGWIAFTIWDTGIGIPPEKQHLIFQKFQQLEQPLTRRFEGTGLGLVLTQGLARLHGGDVSFISKPDEGSQFTLLLPPCPVQGKGGAGAEDWESLIPNLQSPLPLIPKGNASSPTPNHLVLVVETVPQYLERLTEQLKNLGYRVVIARSGTEAIEKARSLQPCAVFLNPLLPQLSGWDVLTILKSDAQTLHIPVLVTATQAEKQQAYHNKADGFLSLPIQEQALRQNLTDLGDRHHSSTSSLTILHLNPELIDRRADSSVLSSELAEALSIQHSEINYRVLEADDLEQAELLARVWHPDVIVLDSAGIADPLAYLKQYSLQTSLTSLPLVTLNHQTTEAANQVSGLSVYPCLAPDNSLKIAALLQVIQIAAGIRHKPNILVMDIGEQGCWAAGEISQSKIPSPNPCNCPILSARQGRKSKLATPPQQSSWLQALTQYLQTAGFGSCLSCSWGQVHRQLQEQNVDLVLIRLKNISDYPAVVKGLMSLAQLQKRPPVLVLDHRLDTQLGDEAVADVLDSTSDLESVLRTVATRILRGSSHSMTQLLDQINQILS